MIMVVTQRPAVFLVAVEQYQRHGSCEPLSELGYLLKENI